MIVLRVLQRRLRRRMSALAACLALAGPTAQVQGQTVRSAALTFDNDGFTFWIPPRQRTDWFYTHGTHLSMTLAAHPPAAGLLGWADEPVCGAPDRGTAERSCVATGLRVAQEIYTPRSLFSYFPAAGDRPYAGWLSARVEAHRIARDRIRTVGLELGVTGPPSGGGQAHLAIHRWLGKAEPGGWELQIPFEVAGALSIRETRLWPATSGDSGGSANLTGSWSADVGTSRTRGALGFGARVGWNAPPGLESRGPGTDGGWIVADMGTEVEFVAHDLFIDGSLWHDTARARREPLIGRLRATVRAGWAQVGLHLSVTNSSRAFAGQIDDHIYGTLGLVVLP